MAVDKNLFLHDLAIVATIKNEGHYLKEWLDYHLLAGVDHFYLYDHESEDNYNEIVKPYVEAGLVTSTSYPSDVNMYVVYNYTISRFKFQSRYMAFIDGDEFIFPKDKTGGGIIETVDEILSHDPNAAGLSMNWQTFGSNGQEKADYSRGVLERFTRRAPRTWNVFPNETPARSQSNIHLKVVQNPRRVDYIADPHFAYYFTGHYSILENGTKLPVKNLPPSLNPDVCVDKIAVNHYQTKSKEEFIAKINRKRADSLINWLTIEMFDVHDRNEEFDDGILKYRDARAEIYQPPDKSHADERLFTALANNLAPTMLTTTPPEFYAGKMETFLTCRAVAEYLKPRLANEALAKSFEEASLNAILRSMANMSLADARLLIRELPNLLSLPYPAAEDLRNAVINIIPQMMNVFHMNSMWRDYVELDYLQRLLKNFER